LAEKFCAPPLNGTDLNAPTRSTKPGKAFLPTNLRSLKYTGDFSKRRGGRARWEVKEDVSWCVADGNCTIHISGQTTNYHRPVIHCPRHCTWPRRAVIVCPLLHPTDNVNALKH